MLKNGPKWAYGPYKKIICWGQYVYQMKGLDQGSTTVHVKIIQFQYFS